MKHHMLKITNMKEKDHVALLILATSGVKNKYLVLGYKVK